jgi:cytoskeletal protein CcmA (bactofilin family)
VRERRIEMLGRNDERELPKTSEINAFLGKGTTFNGEMRFEGMFRIDEKYDGKILSGDSLVVGQTAEVNAEITVKTIIVNGKVNGKISASNRTEIQSSGQIRGDIETSSLVISEGAIFEGNCKMQKRQVSPDEKVSFLKLKEIEAAQVGQGKTEKQVSPSEPAPKDDQKP